MAEWIEEELLRFLDCFIGRLPDGDYRHIRSMVEHREWGIGLEDLCTQLHENAIGLRESEFAKIQELTSTMGLPPKTWNFLARPTRD
jgi:hypothetical protein